MTLESTYDNIEHTHIDDDEYRHAGAYDPKLLITTARDPSIRLIQFAKVVRISFTKTNIEFQHSDCSQLANYIRKLEGQFFQTNT